MFTLDFSKYNLRADCDIADDGDHPCYVMDGGEVDGISVAKVDGFLGNGDGRESEALTNLFAAAPKGYEAIKEAMSCYRVDGTHMIIPQECLYLFQEFLRQTEGK